MVPRLRRFVDVRRGEGLPVLLAFLYIAIVVAAFLLAKPIRNSLFLREYGPYALVYVYAAVPLVLTLFVPVYARIAGRVGSRAMAIVTLLFFAANVVAFWWAFRRVGAVTEPGTPGWLLPGAFYVWVNCFAVVAPVQAWSFANSLFDARQAKRLFGPIGAGASLGAIGGGFLARVLVGPVGGTVNLLLVLAALILAAAGILAVAQARIRRRPASQQSRGTRPHFLESLRRIRRSRYLSLMAALVFVVAIVTQWIAFQLSLVANLRYGGDADALTAFFGTFNFALGIVGFVLQFVLTGPALQRFGIGATILVLPVALGLGSMLILAIPVFWAVLLTSGLDQGLRFSLDKATYELLYLPLPPGERGAVKTAIDIVVNRFADATGAVLLGLATGGFLMLEGLGFGLRGTAAVVIVLAGMWVVLAWRLRSEYVRTIQETIHRHRLHVEEAAGPSAIPLTSGIMRLRLLGGDTSEVLATLDMLEGQAVHKFQPALRTLLTHQAPEVRRRAVALLASSADRQIDARARALLRDPDIGVRTEALLYFTRVRGEDPLAIIEQLGDFADFSIRAGIAAFFAGAQNHDAARALLVEMAGASGPDGPRERQEAARLLPRVAGSLHDLLVPLIRDPDVGVAREAIRSAAQILGDDMIPPLVEALSRPVLSDEAAEALSRYGAAIVDEITGRMRDPETPPPVRRELPQVLVRVASASAELALIEGLLQPDSDLRHSVVVALNKLQGAGMGARLEPAFLELVLATEIAGHYRAYHDRDVLRLRPNNQVELSRVTEAMQQQLERIFRLLNLLLRQRAMHDAYVGVHSDIPAIRAQALEFLENVLRPELRQVVLPLVDSHVSADERTARARRLVPGPLGDVPQAIQTLLGSEDGWMRSCAIFAVGALRLHDLVPMLQRMESSADVAERAAIRLALHRLTSDVEVTVQAPAPAEIGMGVG